MSADDSARGITVGGWMRAGVRILFPWRDSFARLSLEKNWGHRLAVVAFFNTLVWVLGLSWGVAFTALQPEAVRKQWLCSLGIGIAAMLCISYLLQLLYRSLLYVVYGSLENRELKKSAGSA
jgi:hypothetical protein